MENPRMGTRRDKTEGKTQRKMDRWIEEQGLGLTMGQKEKDTTALTYTESWFGWSTATV